MMLDIDNFKGVNDNYGHYEGDMLLVGFGKKLKELVRAEDTVSRAGGDEFLILIQGARRIADIEKVAKKILGSFNYPVSIGTQEIEITSSLGISVYPRDGKVINDLVKKADLAMFEVKKEGKIIISFLSKG
ncbi:MAG: GGDEF domain-containing protein [Actinomycetota bacterium]|nr:GGDEF domain-containing protein [Actinomycetota bacterium]